MARTLDFDLVADEYDRRYAMRGTDYTGIENALRSFAEDAPGGALLELGCGTAHWLSLLAGEKYGVAGVDPSRRMLDVAQAAVPGADLRQGYAERLPWPDASFDRVFVINALHLFTDPSATLREAHRVLRPGGGFMTVGIDPSTGRDRWCVYDYFEGTRERDLQRYPPCTAIRTWMAEAGFARCATQEVQHLMLSVPVEAALAEGRLERSRTSQLTLLTEAEYERGMARIETEARHCTERGEQLELVADLKFLATFGWRDA